MEILHLGTLYGSRNFDKIFSSLDSLYDENKIARGSVTLTNLGSVYTANSAEYLARDDFKLLGERQRVDAMRLAKRADFLLLVQHDDKRSEETIPYKLYDYLNLNMPIILLVKNPEISQICERHRSLVANCGSEQEIKAVIASAMAIFADEKANFPREQVRENRRLEIRSQLVNVIPKIFQ